MTRPLSTFRTILGAQSEHSQKYSSLSYSTLSRDNLPSFRLRKIAGLAGFAHLVTISR
jgi:hypothetical protein